MRFKFGEIYSRVVEIRDCSGERIEDSLACRISYVPGKISRMMSYHTVIMTDCGERIQNPLLIPASPGQP